jgi:hypothetical protein
MRDSLAASVGPVHFSDLRAHLARGAVIIVDRSLDILDVGVAIAKDDKDVVAAWIDKGLLTKPSLEELARWEKIEDARWESLVVAPYVLVKEGPAPRETVN